MEVAEVSTSLFAFFDKIFETSASLWNPMAVKKTIFTSLPDAKVRLGNDPVSAALHFYYYIIVTVLIDCDC